MVSHHSRCAARSWRSHLSTRTARFVVAVALGFGALASADAAQPEGIFLIDDEAQVVHLSDNGGGPHARLIVDTRTPDIAAEAGSALVALGAQVRRRDDLAAIVLAAARAQGLDPRLLQAMIGIESGYAPRAVSPRGALGLMQLMPATARQYGVTDAFDPRQNVHAGARHLRALMDQFGQNIPLALAAYNAGAGAVLRYHGTSPPFAETAAYVPRVLGSYETLQQRAVAP